MTHLMANSGLQFIVREFDFSPEQPFMLPNGRSLKTTMFERFDPFSQKREFDFAVQSQTGQNVPLKSLVSNGFETPVKTTPDGIIMLDPLGLPIIRQDFNPTMLVTVTADEFTAIHTIPTLESYRVAKDFNSTEKVPAFGKLLDRWIPIPLFQTQPDGNTGMAPTGWCRVKISLIRKDKKISRFRVIFAIDTTATTDSMSRLQPWFYTNSKGEHTEPYKEYSICNVASNLLDFFFTSTTDLNGEIIHIPSSEANYFGQLLGVNPNSPDDGTVAEGRYKHLTYYAHLITFLRHLSNLKVRLYNPDMHGITPVDIDLVLDIGNSKTCGILFENGDFTKREMLALRDMTQPWIVYDKSFDMRVVFRQADFGDDIGIENGESLFKWRSLLRVGNEAINLMHRSIEDQGLSKKCNNYSSPKRYLWDTDEFDGNWEYLHIDSDPLSIRSISTMYMDGLTSCLNEDGTVTDTPSYMSKDGCHYSRSSLMTLAFLEIFRQAECQINSESFRDKRGDIDRPRRLRNVIITAPTAMPNTEQVRLRQLARDAFRLLGKDGVERNAINVFPAPEAIESRPSYDIDADRDWCYDEATACQLVYIYAEVQERYGGDARKFFDLRGKPREDMVDKDFEGNVLTIGSIDIGAGTTDLMICSYGLNGLGRVTPVPLFWDSFYLAGDDIMRSIVQNLILEGGERGDTVYGTISSVLQARLRTLSNDDFSKRLDATSIDSHRIDITNILRAASEYARLDAIEKYGRDLMFDYFGGDSANNYDKDRRCRVDFNSQISIPLASYFLQLFSENRPQRDISFSKVFGKFPPAKYLLDHFRNHFGFSFEDIVWEYRPEKLADEIRKIMTPLMEQLSVLLHAFNIDIVMLAGRPTGLPALTDLFLKFYPVSPDRLVRLPEYEVGNWYPFSHGTGEITDQKTIVAVGAFIGYLASHGSGIKGFHLDMSHLAREMGATANYVGKYLSRTRRVDPTLLTPDTSTVNLRIDGFPFIFGCKQLNTPAYESRPLYVLEWTGEETSPMDMTVLLTRSFHENKEQLIIEDAFDRQGRNYKNSIRLKEQTLIDSESGDGDCWLDNGAFKYLKK